MTNFRSHQEITWAEGADPVARHVVCAANKYGDIIVPGARHHDVGMNCLIAALGGRKKLLDDWNNAEEQGFIDQYGVFMSREEAAFVVVANNQPLRNRDPGHRLYSEDLY